MLIPKIIGKRAPDIRTLRVGEKDVEYSVAEKRERYGVYCIALFSTFRSRDDVMILGETWWERWLHASGSITDRVREVLENIQNYYVSREQKSLAGVITAIPAVGDDLKDDCDEEERPIVDLDAIDPPTTTAHREFNAAMSRIVNVDAGVCVISLPFKLDRFIGGHDIK
jgi:hypothetical protein